MSTNALPRRVDKPWGHEEIWAFSAHYVGKILFVRAGQRLSLQHHERKHETLRVLSGELELWEGPSPEALRQRTVGPGEVLEFPPGHLHRLQALSDSEIVEVSTPELDDVVRHQDDYGRA